MRLLPPFIAAAICVGQAWADIPPPPPPKGMKYVGVDNSVVLDKSVTGYVFVLEEGRGPGAPRYTYSKITLSERASGVPSGGRYLYIRVAAIPEEAAKKYATEKELTEALGNNKIEGVHRISFGGSDTLPTTDTRGAVPWKFTITAIDAKKGITVTKERDGKLFEEGKSRESTKPGENNQPEEEPQVHEIRDVRLLFAGVIAVAGIIGLGAWLVGRRRSS